MDDPAAIALVGSALAVASGAYYALFRRRMIDEPETADASQSETPWYMDAREQEAAAEVTASAPAPAASKKKAKPNKKKCNEIEASLSQRPQLPYGATVWHRQAQCECLIVKVQRCLPTAPSFAARPL